jgi:hypothetical protein
MKLRARRLPVDEVCAPLAKLVQPALELRSPGRLDALRSVQRLEKLTDQFRALRAGKRESFLQKAFRFRDLAGISATGIPEWWRREAVPLPRLGRRPRRSRQGAPVRGATPMARSHRSQTVGVGYYRSW